jgi:hypothetical protein
MLLRLDILCRTSSSHYPNQKIFQTSVLTLSNRQIVGTASSIPFAPAYQNDFSHDDRGVPVCDMLRSHLPSLPGPQLYDAKGKKLSGRHPLNNGAFPLGQPPLWPSRHIRISPLFPCARLHRRLDSEVLLHGLWLLSLTNFPEPTSISSTHPILARHAWAFLGTCHHHLLSYSESRELFSCPVPPTLLRHLLTYSSMPHAVVPVEFRSVWRQV